MSRTFRGGSQRERDGRDIRWFQPGYEYWSDRPGNKNGAFQTGRWTKTWTHRAERRQAKKCVEEAVVKQNEMLGFRGCVSSQPFLQRGGPKVPFFGKLRPGAFLV